MAQTATTETTPQEIFLTDYQVPVYLIDDVTLDFSLDEQVDDELATIVQTRLNIKRNPDSRAPMIAPLILHGQELTLVWIKLDGHELEASAYEFGDERLIIHEVPEAFTLEIKTIIHPDKNTALEGLYKSSGNFCTQCEAEGFRRITYFLDQPDVMAKYTTRISAPKADYPVLLSNGNLMEKGDLENGRHYAVWQDPFKKPSYLFALVAGDLVEISDTFTTCSGKDVALKLYVESHNADKCQHAMQSLKNAMRWDEQTFGLEYDLDIYMIVAVEDFNMGAMENKGLNIFNAKYVLAKPETATDRDFEGIEGVIGHEYFHNWTGNRVTCRDWFQLSLKEGLTVFRDEEFTSDRMSRPVKRIEDVKILRSYQFAEDASPMAHPVRPASYIEINNFYTVTVYNKGAEVVRMYHTLLGKENFRKGMDLYFERHDGQAVTTDDFLQAMQDASGVDLTQFKRWYSQAGTPRVSFEENYDPASQRYRLTLKQSCPATPGQTEKLPFHMPIDMALLDSQGHEMVSEVLDFTETEQCFSFDEIKEKPVLSLLRHFSAPVIIENQRSTEELAFLMAHDTDPFNRWDAGQQLAQQLLLSLVEKLQQGKDLALDTPLGKAFSEGFAHLLCDESLDKSLAALALTLPAESYLQDQMAQADPDSVHRARQFVKHALATEHEPLLRKVYLANTAKGEYQFNATAVGQRSLRNACLSYLVTLETKDVFELAKTHYEQANNMTDSMAALQALSAYDVSQREHCLSDFESRWMDDSLVMDKWLSVQALSPNADTLDKVKDLMSHQVFDIKNPNKVRAVIGAFTQNSVQFHRADGAGYAFLADRVLELDPLNPQIAARLVKTMSRWQRYDENRQALMRAQLQRIVDSEHVSKDVYEIASKSLVTD